MAGDEEVVKLQGGNRYLNRNLKHIGMINASDQVFTAFTNHGWIWGGFFDKGADYMHFEKWIRPHYLVNSLKYLPESELIPNLELLK